MLKVRKQHLHELVSDAIQKYIEENRLRSGDRLPSVQEWTKLLGVSRTSLREGMRYLEAVGVIRVENGRGIFVDNPAANGFKLTGKVKLEGEKRFLLHILDVRRALEGKAVELAAIRAGEDDLREMEECLLTVKRSRDEGKDTSEIDFRFHQCIFKAANNPVLQSVFESIQEHYSKFFIEPLGSKGLFDNTDEYHRTMFEGIKRRDPVLALTEFNRLMDKIEEDIKNYEQAHT